MENKNKKMKKFLVDTQEDKASSRMLVFSLLYAEFSSDFSLKHMIAKLMFIDQNLCINSGIMDLTEWESPNSHWYHTIMLGTI